MTSAWQTASTNRGTFGRGSRASWAHYGQCLSLPPAWCTSLRVRAEMGASRSTQDVSNHLQWISMTILRLSGFDEVLVDPMWPKSPCYAGENVTSGPRFPSCHLTGRSQGPEQHSLHNTRIKTSCQVDGEELSSNVFPHPTQNSLTWRLEGHRGAAPTSPSSAVQRSTPSH